MSLLHRQLLSAAFQQMMEKFEPIVKDTLETAVAVVAPGAAPVVNAAVELAEQALAPTGEINANHVDTAVARATPAASAAPATAPAPVANLAAGPAQAALAACDALAITLSQVATQLAALRANVTGSAS